MRIEDISGFVRTVPDFPKEGILFKDITPLLANADAFRSTIDLMAEMITQHDADEIVGIESRGFIFGAALAQKMGLPLQLVRKVGKLPYKRVGVSYDLEYGSDRVEMHVDAISKGKRYAIVDDLIATGGTAAASAELIELEKGTVACLAFVIELDALDGRSRLGQRPITSLLRY
ncbi:MAG: adenine phosphoribosyltransferase [Deltaproteobacteria bacterium]|nr:adenine phosphoribosyltransferase [Deltaproteobacteria bacterium]